MLLTILILGSLATLPAFGQMAGMPGSKTAGKPGSANVKTDKTAMCCMAGMKTGSMGKMMTGMTAADKKKMGKCCMAGMKPAGMKMGDMGSGGMKMGDAKKMGQCCMVGMKAAGMKPGSKPMPGAMGGDKKPSGKGTSSNSGAEMGHK